MNDSPGFHARAPEPGPAERSDETPNDAETANPSGTPPPPPADTDAAAGPDDDGWLPV